MKLLFENWRRFLAEDETTIEIPNSAKNLAKQWLKDAQELLGNQGLYVNKELGRGKMGIVYEVEDENSGRRLAAKFVKKDNPNARRERENYEWMMNNRERLPEDVSKHLVEVYDIIERDTVYIFLIELLEAPDKKTVRQLLALGDYDDMARPDKEARIFKDEGAIFDLVKDVVMSADSLMAQANASQAETKSTVREIHRKFLSGEGASRELIGKVYFGDLDYYMGATEDRRRLINLILSELLSLIEPEMVEHIANSLARIVDSKTNYFLQKQVIPIHDFSPRSGLTGGAEGYTKEAFPEADSLMRAMQHLTKKEQFSPGDIHVKNVMARPGSRELVIMDLGLFKTL